MGGSCHPPPLPSGTNTICISPCDVVRKCCLSSLNFFMPILGIASWTSSLSTSRSSHVRSVRQGRQITRPAATAPLRRGLLLCSSCGNGVHQSLTRCSMASVGSRNAKGRRRGMTIKFYDGQRYELVRTEPYTRLDGGHTTLAVWRPACPTCGEMFETRTPVRARRFSCRRCPRHKRPGVRVNRPRGAEACK